MEKRYARRLHNRDQVEVRVGPGEWSYGYVLGDAWETSEGVFVNVQTQAGYMQNIRHTDLR